MLPFQLELLQILTPYRKLGFTDQRLSPFTWEIPRFLYTFVLTCFGKNFAPPRQKYIFDFVHCNSIQAPQLFAQKERKFKRAKQNFGETERKQKNCSILPAVSSDNLSELVAKKSRQFFRISGQKVPTIFLNQWPKSPDNLSELVAKKSKIYSFQSKRELTLVIEVVYYYYLFYNSIILFYILLTLTLTPL